MSTKLKAGTATSGAVLDADTTGILELQSGSTPTTAITVDTSQNVGIGTASPSTRLQITNASASGTGIINTLRLQHLGTSADDGAKILFTAGSSTDGAGIGSGGKALNSANLLFYTGGANERMRIDQDGDLLVGASTISGAGKTKIKTAEWTIGSTVNGSGGLGHIAFYNTNGLVGYISTNGSATAYNTSSDYRLKENIAPMTGALNRISALKPVTYKWKIDGSDGEGFIAHELADVLPQAVTGEKDAVDAEGKPVYQGIDTSFLIATLTAAIQELKAEVDALKGVK